MGFAEDSTHSYIERSLKRAFPPREGWELRRRPDRSEGSPDYFLQKKRFGRTRRVLVGVILEPKILSIHMEPLFAYAGKMERLLLPTERILLVVPDEADISEVPVGVDIIYLDVLRVENGDIMWVKKFVQEIPEAGDQPVDE
jgi:hypothetical protein